MSGAWRTADGTECTLYHKNAPNGMTWLRIRDGYGIPHSDFWTPAWALEAAGWHTEPISTPSK